MTLEVRDLTGVALVQDLGRPGRTSSGLSASGAFDRGALRQANALVGNPSEFACIEALSTSLELCAHSPLLMAVTGASGPIDVDGTPVSCGRAVHVPGGACLRLGAPVSGMRYYIAVRGGLDVCPVLGSRSADTMARIGPAALSPGQTLAVGSCRGTEIPAAEIPTGIVTTILDVIPGPRHDWFTSQALVNMFTATWRVSGSSDRIGIRLDGPALERLSDDELPSEPCLRGSIQVDHTGQPIILGPDHPVTGGYPVIGVIINPDALGQLMPGQEVWFSRRIAP